MTNLDEHEGKSTKVRKERTPLASSVVSTALLFTVVVCPSRRSMLPMLPSGSSTAFPSCHPKVGVAFQDRGIQLSLKGTMFDAFQESGGWFAGQAQITHTHTHTHTTHTHTRHTHTNDAHTHTHDTHTHTITHTHHHSPLCKRSEDADAQIMSAA